VYDKDGNIVSRVNTSSPVMGLINPMVTPDGWLLELRAPDACPGGCQSPGDTLIALSKEFAVVDTFWTDGVFFQEDEHGTYTTPIIIDGHDEMAFMWNGEIYYLILGYSERLLRYSDYGFSCDYQFFQGELTSVFLFKAGPGPGEFVAKYEPWKFMTPTPPCAQNAVSRWPHLNRFSKGDIRPLMTDTSITFSFSGRNEASVHVITYTPGDSIMRPSYVLGETYVFNQYMAHSYEDVFIDTDGGNTLAKIHGAGIIRTDTCDIIAIHNNNSQTGLPSSKALVKVKDGTASLLWSDPDEGYTSFCCGDAQALSGGLFMYERGNGSVHLGGTSWVPISDVLGDSILSEYPEYSFLGVLGNTIAHIDLPGWSNGQVSYMQTSEWFPYLDSATVLVSGDSATITCMDVVRWETLDNELIGITDEITIPVTYIDSIIGWKALNFFEWRVPRRSVEVVGVEALESKVSFRVFPNPTDGWFRVEVDGHSVEEYEISNILGSSVKKSESLAPGCYVIRINHDGYVLSQKLIVR